MSRFLSGTGTGDLIAIIEGAGFLAVGRPPSCGKGGSTGLVVVAYLMFEHGWSRDQALAFARTRRPDTRPNPAFMDRLLDWERELRRD